MIYGYNYDTGTGNSTVVDKVIVENLTKGSSVTVNSNETLVLTDLINSINQLQEKDNFVLLKLDNAGRYQLNLNSDVIDGVINRIYRSINKKDHIYFDT